MGAEDDLKEQGMLVCPRGVQRVTKARSEKPGLVIYTMNIAQFLRNQVNSVREPLSAYKTNSSNSSETTDDEDSLFRV